MTLDALGDRMHDAVHALLVALSTGRCPWGDSPSVALKDLMELPELQAVSDAADAWERETRAP